LSRPNYGELTTSTLLPANSVDKVIIENTFHEFSKPSQMLKEIHRILKPNGILYLNEMLASENNKIHSGCKQKLVSENELQQFCAENKLTITRIEIGSKEFRKDFNKLIEIKKLKL
jgi:ubiquinone/menaquinone biosynthesis C-methylase UbiE